MKIGVVGSGRIGGRVGALWVRVGHEVMFASRHPEQLRAMAEGLNREVEGQGAALRDAASRLPRVREGGGAAVGTAAEAAAFGEVVFISVPYAALPEVGRDLAPILRGKIVLESGNPYPERDGDMAAEVRASGRGTGPYSQEWLPGTRLVRAFNSVRFNIIDSEAHRSGDRVGVPLASDDPDAMEVAAGLVRDAGFEPVVVGGLDRARAFDVGTPVYNTGMSGVELRRALGLPEAASVDPPR